MTILKSGPRFIQGGKTERSHTVPCPNCQKSITLPARSFFPGNKVACPECNGEIEMSGPDLREVEDLLDAHEDRVKEIFRKF